MLQEEQLPSWGAFKERAGEVRARGGSFSPPPFLFPPPLCWQMRLLSVERLRRAKGEGGGMGLQPALGAGMYLCGCLSGSVQEITALRTGCCGSPGSRLRLSVAV